MSKDKIEEADHCDEYVWGFKRRSVPECVWWFLFVNRQPAALIHPLIQRAGGKDPTLFATYKGKRVKVVMASRFGDVGITTNLDAVDGYDNRVSISDLAEFAEDK